jgi:hypothetical protein
MVPWEYDSHGTLSTELIIDMFKCFVSRVALQRNCCADVLQIWPRGFYPPQRKCLSLQLFSTAVYFLRLFCKFLQAIMKSTLFGKIKFQSFR